MFWGILINGLILILIIIGIIATIREKEYVSVFFLTLMSFLPGTLLWFFISAAVNGNQSEVEWKFPADTYTLVTEVKVTEQEAIINGEKATLITRDTTYIIRGIQPTIGDNPYEHSERELKRCEIQ